MSFCLCIGLFPNRGLSNEQIVVTRKHHMDHRYGHTRRVRSNLCKMAATGNDLPSFKIGLEIRVFVAASIDRGLFTDSILSHDKWK